MRRYILFLGFALFSLSMSEYGEYDVRLMKFEDCNGPKRKNCTVSKSSLENGTYLISDLTITEETPVIQGKIIAKLNGKDWYKRHIKDLCQQVFLKPIIQVVLKSPNHCAIHKGHYSFRINLPQIMQNVSKSYILGTWEYHVVFHSDHCNLFCCHLEILLSPHKSS